MDGSPLQGMRAYIMTQTSAFAPTSNYREHHPLTFAEHNELLSRQAAPYLRRITQSPALPQQMAFK